MPGEAEGEARSRNRDNYPDPSVLTTQALYREIASVKEQFEKQLEGAIASIKVRLDAIDKATKVFEDNLYRVPTEVDKAISHLQSLHGERFLSVQHQIDAAEKLRNEKFSAVQQQFQDRDTRDMQTREQSEVSISAALQAAKEAVGKAEASTDKRIDAQSAVIVSATDALRTTIDDLKQRVVRIESMGVGQSVAKTEQHQSSAFIISVIAIGLAVIGALVTIATFVRTAIGR